MAAGDIKWFQEGLLQLGNKIHNLSSDALQLGIVTTTTVPTMATAIPHWGGTAALGMTTRIFAGSGVPAPRVFVQP